MVKRNLIWLGIIAAMAVALALVWRQPTGGANRPGQFEPVQKAYELIQQRYYQPIDDEDLQRAAVRGMVRELDAFSTYVPYSEAKALTHRVMGAVRGLGLLAQWKDGKAVVIGALPDSPAFAARLFADDTILSIDDQPVSGMNERQFHRMLNVPPGQKLRLQACDGLSGQVRRITLTGKEFPVETVQGLYRDDFGQWVWTLSESEGIGYVRIAEFCPKTAQQLGNVLRGAGEVRGLVLDLRNDPGGVLPDGVAVADLFLKEGVIVRIVERGETSELCRAHSDTPYAGIPLVILVDDRTASAAELVAGALAANARAILVGQRTCGKGCVQTIYPLPGRLGQIHLTTAEFIIPPDQSIQRRPGCEDWGVQPQIVVNLSPEKLRQLRRARLETTVMPRVQKKSPSSDEASAPAKRILSDDPQLARAVALLRRPQEMQALQKKLRQAKIQAEERYRLRLEAAKQRKAKDREHD